MLILVIFLYFRLWNNACVIVCRFYVVHIKGYVWILPECRDKDKIRALPVQSKRYITKVMFLCAVAKPMYDECGVCIFDGKVGCWRVADWKKCSRNYTGKFTKYQKGGVYIQDCSMGAHKYEQMMVELFYLMSKIS